MFLGLTRRQLILIVVFTVVELVTLTIWLVLLKVPLHNHLAAGLTLGIGLLIEHTIATIAGKP